MSKTQAPGRGRLSRPILAEGPLCKSGDCLRNREQRIHDLEAATRELAAEYQNWLNALPENLAEGEMADQLTDTIEQLEAIADGLDAIDPPTIGAKPRPAAP